MSTLVRKRLINVDEYYRMGETGMFHPEERIELINGEILNMAPIGSKHAAVVKLLATQFFRIYDNKAIVSVQDPLILDDWNEFQPDIALLEYKKDYYAPSHPTPDNVHLIVEVSDTTYNFDRNVKLPIYASTGIPVYWIINLNEKCIEVYEEPLEGQYRKRTLYFPGDSIPILADSLSVDEILIK